MNGYEWLLDGIEGFENVEDPKRLEKFWYIVDDRHKKYSEFVNRVADEVVTELDENDKKYMRENPDSGKYHFGLGLYIRNKHIYRPHQNFDIVFKEPDDVSDDILKRIIYLLTEIKPEDQVD